MAKEAKGKQSKHGAKPGGLSRIQAKRNEAGRKEKKKGRKKYTWGTTWDKGTERVPYLTETPELCARRDRLFALVDQQLAVGQGGKVIITPAKDGKPEEFVYGWRGYA